MKTHNIPIPKTHVPKMLLIRAGVGDSPVCDGVGVGDSTVCDGPGLIGSVCESCSNANQSAVAALQEMENVAKTQPVK